MNMKGAMVEVVKMSQEQGRLCYLYNHHGEYEASFTFWPDWLFKAYPGGRKQLSLEGTRLFQQNRSCLS